MKTREQIYSREAADILRDITMYRALTEEQLLRLYPDRKRQVQSLLAHLVRQGRVIHKEGSALYCANEEAARNVDRGLSAAVWVLADFIGSVEYHSSGDFPAKIIFFAEGEVYEVIYVPWGKEALISHALSTAEDDPPYYIVIVDRPEQITEIDIPNVRGFCTVSPDGDLQYYKKE